MNIHDKSIDLVEDFYYKVIPDANLTCNTICKTPTSFHKNPSKYLGYANLAYHMCKISLVNIRNNQAMALITTIKNHQTNTLGLSSEDFKLIYLSSDMLQRLLEKSLKYERAILPELDRSELKANFEKQAMSKSCVIDVKHVSGQSE